MTATTACRQRFTSRGARLTRRTLAVLTIAGVLLCFGAARAAGVVSPPSTDVKKSTVRFGDVGTWIAAELFSPDFPVGDSNYHCLTAASDGTVHFVVNTHNTRYGCRYYVFEPTTGQMTLAGKLDEVLGEPAATHVPQGKVHVPLFEHGGKMWFATHTAFYRGELPEFDTGGRKPYRGGHFMSYDLTTRQFADLGVGVPGEGIITLAMDKTRGLLYGLTWPSGILLSYDIATQEIRCWGSVQGRGEWGRHPDEWDRVCRTLGVTPAGEVFGATMDGRIWKFDPNQYNSVSYIDGLDLSRVPRSQSAEHTLKGDFENNWRALEWNPATSSFWGILWDTTALFEFVPAKNYIRALGELRVDAYRDMPRNPEASQLGFMLGPQNTIFHLGHGPAVELENRPAVQSSVHLITYDMTTGRQTDHGPVLAREGDTYRRVFFTESIAIGPDQHLYTVAWVEVADPARCKELAAARAYGPGETAGMIYEMMLVRLPEWKHFLRKKP